jgi:PilZ domain
MAHAFGLARATHMSKQAELDNPMIRARRDRREYARPGVDLRVRVVSDGFAHDCRTVNASRGGMVVELTRALAATEPHFVYRYELEIEGQPRIPIVGRTAWRRARLQGVKFVVVSELDRAAFDEYLHNVARLVGNDLERLAMAEELDRWRAQRQAAALTVS